MLYHILFENILFRDLQILFTDRYIQIQDKIYIYINYAINTNFKTVLTI